MNSPIESPDLASLVGWSGSLVAWPGGCKSEQFRDRLVAVVFRGLFEDEPRARQRVQQHG
ncbi:hypothetical protein BBK14_15680 [Parafrankia soli]|uniref:Uncharacterized protein n=1 Tax=Parafrankia soli TaxID=2599596 RepID=A0A1S1QFY6_9ACTN|nr:hypothetical protein [Parafrankia soli]OHV32145.1 hypothetical protein BBK14_15680 [Parafrankia soli]